MRSPPITEPQNSIGTQRNNRLDGHRDWPYEGYHKEKGGWERKEKKGKEWARPAFSVPIGRPTNAIIVVASQSLVLAKGVLAAIFREPVHARAISSVVMPRNWIVFGSQILRQCLKTCTDFPLYLMGKKIYSFLLPKNRIMPTNRAKKDIFLPNPLKEKNLTER